MARKKSDDSAKLLACPIRTRVTETVFKRLEKIKQESACQSVAEVARMILSGDKINCFYTDRSLSGPMEEMALIRKELKSIGININQQTRYFNSSKTDVQKVFYAVRTADLNKKVEAKVDELLAIINVLAKKWLQDS